jgi:hypothetical protein
MILKSFNRRLRRFSQIKNQFLSLVLKTSSECNDLFLLSLYAFTFLLLTFRRGNFAETSSAALHSEYNAEGVALLLHEQTNEKMNAEGVLLL